MSFWNIVKNIAVRAQCITVCDDCVRPKEPVLDRGEFGDFSLCSRCQRSVTSADRANYVRPSGEFPNRPSCCS